MQTDPELYQKHLTYFRWSDALWRHYFVGRPGLRVRLSVDDDEIERLGRSLEILHPRINFLLAVRSIVERYDSDIFRCAIAADRIARNVQTDAPGYLGILGACVLIASRMAADDQNAGNAYFPRFNRDVLGEELDSRPKGFEDLRQIWNKLRILLDKNSGQYGVLGVPTDTTNTPLRNRPNINLPLSQCLFRRADLDRLDEALRDWLRLGLDGENAFTELTQHVKMWPERFTVALRKNIAIATKDDDLKIAYVDELQDLLANIATVAVSDGKKREERFGLGSARVRCYPRQGPSGAVYDFALEVGSADNWQVAEDVRLESGDVVGRVRTIFDGREYRYSGFNPQVFIEDENGDCLTTRPPRLPSYGRVVIVSTTAVSSEILNFAAAITRSAAHPSGDIQILPVMDRFAMLTAVSFHFSSKAAEKVPLPACLNRFSLFGRFHIRLVGGLSIEDSFLPDALPSIEGLWEGAGSVPKVDCDGVELHGVESQGRIEYELPEIANQVGLHIVSVSDGSKIPFTVATPERRSRATDSKDLPKVAIYFGPQFLIWVRSAKELKLACKQSGGANPSALLVQGARVLERAPRNQL